MMSCCYFILFVMLTTSNWAAVRIEDNKIILPHKTITLKDSEMIQIGEISRDKVLAKTLACYQLKTAASLTSATAKTGCIYQRIDCTTAESSGAATDKDLTDILNRFEHIQIIPRFKGRTLTFRLRILLSEPKLSTRRIHRDARLEIAESMHRIEELSKLKEHSLPLPLGECPIDSPPYDSHIVNAEFRVVDYKKSKLKGLRAAPTQSFQLELTEFMSIACGDLIEAIFEGRQFYPEGKPGKLIRGAKVFGLEKEAGVAARARFGSTAAYRTTNCMRLGVPTAFVALGTALDWGLAPAYVITTHTKLNYVITNINGEASGPKDARFVWRFMHSTGGKVSDVRAKHWILNEENLGKPLLAAGEMMIYTRPEVLHPFTPVMLLMDSCSGTFKPSITDEMIGLFQNMFGFTQRYDDRIFLGGFKYTVLTPPKGDEKHGIFSVIMIRDALDEGRKGKDNCVRKWIEHFDIKMQT